MAAKRRREKDADADEEDDNNKENDSDEASTVDSKTIQVQLERSASRVDPLHLEYFRFAGRVIALALMHKVQVGVVFDRVFFQQLAGMHVSLEDIRETDPYLYSSCKKLLEMDVEFVDSDALGLTFVREVEELGSRRLVELCDGGKNISVNSSNRQEYVDLLIRDGFVTSISEQCVREMSVEQRKILLFFWTSLTHLPVEGFRGA